MADRKSESEKKKTDTKKSEAKPPSSKGVSTPIKFNKNITILPNKPLPQFDRGDVKAYQAEGKGKVPAKLIAYVCEKHLVPRWESASTYSRLFNPNIAHLIATGAVLWTPENLERFIVIYELNWGSLLFSKDKKQAFAIKPDIIMEQFLPAFVTILKDFNEKGFIHSGIRLDNIFSISEGSLKGFVLGDSIATPASYLQSAEYEPIERAMADPVARGLGHFVDDIYSMGVVLAVLMRVSNPVEGLSPKEIINLKIEKGSYTALTGKERFTGAILELLRGVLHDDKSQRWTIEEVSDWMEGQRLGPKQALKRKKATRVFHVEGNRYFRPEILAADLMEYEPQITEYLEDEKFELWIKRSLEDKETLELFELAISSAKDGGVNDLYPHRLTSRVSIALDPPAPIRYRDIVFRPDGFGSTLADAFATGKKLAPFAEILEQGLIMFWLNAQSDKTIDYGSIATRFESCRSVLKNKAAGFGLERCLYFLNTSAPCYSTKLKNFYVKTPEEMVMAFENLCKNNQITKLFLDRHSIAFLSVKDSRILDSYLIELNAEEEYKKILGNIWAISNIQKRYEMSALPNIATHVVKIMDPVLERFHDRSLRERMQKEFEKIKKTGNLSLLTAILKNPEIIEQDTKSFFKAMAKYKVMEKEKSTLERKLGAKDRLGNTTGRTVAAIVSLAIGGIGIITLTLLKLSEMGLFS